MSETSDESGSINSANKSENDNRGERRKLILNKMTKMQKFPAFFFIFRTIF